MPNNLVKRIAFFGTPEFAVSLLNELKSGGIVPDLIVTNPDEPRGRKLIITPPPVKIWAIKHNIKVLQPKTLKTNETKQLEDLKADLFIVAAYGKIIPESIIKLPKYGAINVHPSLLPKYRGPSPVQASILNGNKETGVSIMLLDKDIDHGPVIAQEKLNLSDWNPYIEELKDRLAKIAGQLIIKILSSWISGNLRAVPQNHNQATFTKKISKEDGFIETKELFNINTDLEQESSRINKVMGIERKIRALTPDPGVFTFIKTKNGKLRLKIVKARVQDNKLIIERVIPEGKKEMEWEDFKRGNL